MFDPKSAQRIRTLPVTISPVEMAAGLAHLPGLVFLDSSSAEGIEHQLARNVSIIAARPRRCYSGNIHDAGSQEILRQCLAANRVEGIDHGFPVGGLVGGVEYNGDFFFGEYPEMLIFDYSKQNWFEIGNLSRSFNPSATIQGANPQDTYAPGLAVPGASYRAEFRQKLTFRDSIDKESFIKQVKRAIEYIAAGDIYQVNLSHRLEAEWNGTDRDSLALYRKLREVSPAPFSGYLRLGATRTVLSASPEQFLRISGRVIETRPIKGTRPRFRDREKDEKSAYDLITSPKEISELIMITDLERNDLGQICDFGTVEATELMKLERFAQVFHLISTVQGQLREEVDHVTALSACFPGGSITGAPKKRAREIIEELETVPRGLYTGTLGCIGFNDESFFNIVIRTAICEGNKIHFHVGAGIVADSIPEAEWEETLHKASGILRATSGEV